MSRIWWLASYPKSGNTWFRAFLTGLLRRELEGCLLEELEGGPIASARDLFEMETGVDSDELTFAESQILRAEVYRSHARRETQPLFLKIHDARVDPVSGAELVPGDITAGAIYLLRNPLDVAVSWAHHCSREPNWGAGGLGKLDFSIGANDSRGGNQLRQVMGSWSQHVSSWVDHGEFPVLTLRFEDLLNDPHGSFGRAARFLELEYDDRDLQRAIEGARFERLQQAEQVHGFAERRSRTAPFFRRGRSGSWRGELTADAVARIVADHTEIMRRFGYLDTDGSPV